VSPAWSVPLPESPTLSACIAAMSGPITIVNQVLQGKFVPAGQDTLRFVINTTLGWGGIFDVASGAALPQHNEDSGQTLGRWGVPAGPYLMLPLLGPASLRDAPARIVDDSCSRCAGTAPAPPAGLIRLERARYARQVPAARGFVEAGVRPVCVHP
jgi:ABC-type transporter lipoprotein component MlaA